MIQLLSKYKSYIFSFLFMVGMILSVTIFAAEPSRTLGFQGQFYTYNTPGNAPVSATFTFYDSLSGGNVTGTPISKIIQVVNGYFGTTFSESDTTGVDLNQQLYLEISINGTTLSPRTTVNPTVSSLKSFGTFSYASAPTVGPAGSLYFNTTSGELYVSNGTSWQLSGLASSTTQWVANGTSLNYMAGNVGIGTTTPSSPLTVVGNTSNTGLNIFEFYSGGGTLRTNLTDRGGQSWFLQASAGTEVGSVSISTPGNLPGIIFKNPTSEARSDFKMAASGGFIWGSYASSTATPPTHMILDTDGNLRLGISVSGGNKLSIASPNATSSQISLISSRSAIVNTNIIGGIDFVSNDTNITVFAPPVASIQALANQTHTATALGTDLAFNVTNGTTTSEALRILGNGNVGIGTSTPISKFAVKGSGTSTGLLAQFTDSTNTPKVTILDNGNIGLGTDNPVFALTLSGVFPTIGFTNGTSTLNIQGGDTPRFVFIDGRSGGRRFDIGTDSSTVGAYSIKDGTAGVVRFLVAPSGNIGIATTTPGSTLTVDGSFIVASSTAISTFVGNVAIGNSPATASGTLSIKPFTNQTQLYLQQDNSALGFGIWMDSATGQLKFVRAGANILTLGTNASNTSTFLTPLTISGDLSANNITVTAGNKLNFSNGSEIKRITSDGHMQYLSQNGIHELVGTIQTGSITATSTATSTFVGAVGIGTVNPTAPFSVQERIQMGAWVANSTFNAFYLNGQFATSTAYSLMSQAGTNDLYVNRLSGGSIRFRENNGSDQMIILPGGNIGIGTSTPGVPLTVAGRTSVTGVLDARGGSYTSGVNWYSLALGQRSQGDGSSNIIFNGTTNARGWSVGAIDTGSNPYFQFYDLTANAERMRIDANGNLGIGTTTPGAKLHVFGTTEQLRLGYNATNYVPFTVNSSGSLNIVPVGTVPYIMIGAGTTPESELSLTGVMSFSSRVGSSTFVTGSNAKIYSTAAGGTYPFNQNNNLVIQPRTVGGSFDLIFATFDGSTVDSRMVVRANGNVGIGTTTASQILVASGTIQSTALLGGATTLSTDANGNIIRTPSDQKLKTNVETLTSALDKVNQMRGVSYNWIDTNRFGTSSEIGFIAQELETIVPEVVKSGGEYKSVNYQNLTALLTEAIKELSAKFDGLSESIQTKFVKTNKIETTELCVEDICVTREQFKRMLEREMNSPQNFVPTPPTSINIISTSTPDVEEEQPETRAPDPTPEPPAEAPVETPPTE